MTDASGAADAVGVQARYAPASRCFGCGPANDRGLRLRSLPAPDGDGLVATFTPEPHHEAFPGMMNGGIIGALLDCHSNWAAAMHLKGAADAPPCTVTADFHVKLRRPTPMKEVLLRARVVETPAPDRAVVEATLSCDGQVCATCRGTFVAVKEGHPAFHRW